MERQTSQPNDKQKIIKHYDVISPYYRSLWGEHIHHGYWIWGDESKEKAQLRLIEHLPQSRQCEAAFRCSRYWLRHRCQQPPSGQNVSRERNWNNDFRSSGGNSKESRSGRARRQSEIPVDGRRGNDFPESVRSSLVCGIHFALRAARGVFRLCCEVAEARRKRWQSSSWFKKDNLTPFQIRKFIDPIEKGMLAKLQN